MNHAAAPPAWYLRPSDAPNTVEQILLLLEENSLLRQMSRDSAELAMNLEELNALRLEMIRDLLEEAGRPRNELDGVTRAGEDED